MQNPPLLSIIIVAYQSRDEIGPCLASLPRVLSARPVEVIVVDNSPGDGTAEIIKNLQKITKKIEVIDANGICQKELGTPVVSGIYLLCLAAFKGMIPLAPDTMLEAIKSSVAPKHLELNIKTFELAQKMAQ